MTDLQRARLIALFAPLLLLGGALASQYVGGLYPCEMCYWQRWPHAAAILLALAAFAAKPAARPLTLLAALAILVSGLIGVFHAGVEYGWWEGLTQCSAGGVTGRTSADVLADIMATPLVRCDQPQWTLGPISLAGFNAIFSIGAAVAIVLLRSRSRRAA